MLSRFRNIPISGRRRFRMTVTLWLAGLLALACSRDQEEELSATTSGNVGRPAAVPLPNFAFGVTDSKSVFPGNEHVRAIDRWVDDVFDPSVHGTRVRAALDAGKVPLVYASVVGKAASLYACNAGVPSDQTLCTQGASYVRAHGDTLVGIYTSLATQYAATLAGAPGLLHIEPNWYQYTIPEQRYPLTPADAATTMNRIMTAVKSSCPTCAIVADVSTWTRDLKGYFANWDMAKVAYVGLVGKRFMPEGSDGKSYGELVRLLGKPLVINDAYGAGNAELGYNKAWDDLTRLQKAANEGVAILVQSSDNALHYKDVINAYLTGASGAGSGSPSPSSSGTTLDGGSPPTGATGAGNDGGTSSPSPSASTPTGTASPPSKTDPKWQTATSSTGWVFEVSPNINNYWIEVGVVPKEEQTVVKVEAIVDNKWWVTLDKMSNGHYGKNSYVGTGSSVVFRAWDGTNPAHDSPPRVW